MTWKNHRFTPSTVARSLLATGFVAMGLAGAAHAKDLPGKGVTVQPLQSSIAEETFQTLLVSRALEKLGYTVQTQPSLDKNTVDMDRERANFTDNAVRYEATLRFLNGQAKTMLSAIQGQ